MVDRNRARGNERPGRNAEVRGRGRRRGRDRWRRGKKIGRENWVESELKGKSVERSRGPIRGDGCVNPVLKISRNLIFLVSFAGLPKLGLHYSVIGAGECGVF